MHFWEEINYVPHFKSNSLSSCLQSVLCVIIYTVDSKTLVTKKVQYVFTEELALIFPVHLEILGQGERCQRLFLAIILFSGHSV